MKHIESKLMDIQEALFDLRSDIVNDETGTIGQDNKISSIKQELREVLKLLWKPQETEYICKLCKHPLVNSGGIITEKDKVICAKCALESGAI